MAEQPTNYRFDAIYIAAAGSEPPTANAATVLTPATAGLYEATTRYGTAASESWTDSYSCFNMIAAQSVIVSNSAFVGMPSLWRTDVSVDYQELGNALAELSESVDEEWKIDQPVYNVAQIVASDLMMGEYPAPKLLIHGPKSVVFFWGYGTNNLYVTVSADHLSLVVSSKDGVQLRMDLPQSALLGTSLLSPAIESARLGRPVIARKQSVGTSS